MSDKINVVITMAGIGARFRKVGFNTPKYQIEVRNKTLFEWSMSSLEGLKSSIRKYIFVIRKEDKSKDFLRNKCTLLSIDNYEIVEINHTTDGQASTALIAIEYCDKNSSLLIYNIDTFVKPHEMSASDFGSTAHIPCFEASGNQWSFVKVDKLGFVTEVSEKKRISNNCSIGAYYFPTIDSFKQSYESYYNNHTNLVHKEKYIAPIYNHLIQNGQRVTFNIIDSSSVYILGTPEDLEKFERNKTIE
jgi:dTDP-glucose pyrophosphorylase